MNYTEKQREELLYELVEVFDQNKEEKMTIEQLRRHLPIGLRGYNSQFIVGQLSQLYNFGWINKTITSNNVYSYWYYEPEDKKEHASSSIELEKQEEIVNEFLERLYLDMQ